MSTQFQLLCLTHTVAVIPAVPCLTMIAGPALPRHRHGPVHDRSLFHDPSPHLAPSPLSRFKIQRNPLSRSLVGLAVAAWVEAAAVCLRSPLRPPLLSVHPGDRTLVEVPLIVASDRGFQPKSRPISQC